MGILLMGGSTLPGLQVDALFHAMKGQVPAGKPALANDGVSEMFVDRDRGRIATVDIQPDAAHPSRHRALLREAHQRGTDATTLVCGRHA